ncbi:MAG: class I SAM-dependent methyltransferase [Acidobacteria bacterium]|nr:class I SAM-dependent methyltransferase [Acidobacteriota bacterium]
MSDQRAAPPPSAAAPHRGFRGTCTTTRTACRTCGSARLALLVDYGQMPLAGGFLTREELGCQAAFPLRLARCEACTEMQILDVVPPSEIFTQYSYVSSTTRTLIDHFAAMGSEIVAQEQAAGRLVVEFGCNDGVLMRPLRAAGARVAGVDPSDVAARASRADGWPLVQAYFDASSAARVRAEHGAARIVTGNNVFAHVDDLHAIVEGVTTLLEPEGVFIFEVQYQGDLLALVQYDTVYHEHVCYHSLAALSRLLEGHALRIVDVKRIPIHAGSVRVTVARAGTPRREAPVVGEMLEAERGWRVDRFPALVEDRRRALKALVVELRAAGKRVVGYGAAGRSTILLNFCGLGPDLVEYVVDMSPLRYGKYVPGVSIPIVPPETFHASPPDVAIMTAWNYEDEIVKKEAAFLRAGGAFIVPLPDVRVVTS